MTVAELATLLRRAYERPPSGKKTVEIHLFGLRHARSLQRVAIDDVIARAGISKSYGTEIRKMVALAPYVQVIDPE